MLQCFLAVLNFPECCSIASTFFPKVQLYSPVLILVLKVHCCPPVLIFFPIVQCCPPASPLLPIVQCWSRDVSAMMYCPSPGPSQTPETDTKRREREGAAILPPASYHHLHLCYLNMNCNKSLLCCVFLNCCIRVLLIHCKCCQ